MENHIKHIIKKYYNKIDNIQELYNSCITFSPILLNKMLKGKCFVSKDKLNFIKQKKRYIFIEDVNKECKDLCFNLIKVPGHSLILYICTTYFTVIDPAGKIKEHNNYINIIKKELKNLPYIEISQVEIQSVTKDYYCGVWSFLIGYLICKYDKDPREVVKFLREDNMPLKRLIESFICYLYSVLKETQLYDIAKKLSTLKDNYLKCKITVKHIKLLSKIDGIIKMVIKDNDIEKAEKEVKHIMKYTERNKIWDKLPEVNETCKIFLAKLHKKCKHHENVFLEFIKKIHIDDNIDDIIDILDQEEDIIEILGENKYDEFINNYYKYYIVY